MFHKFADAVAKKISSFSKKSNQVFQVSLTKEEIWEKYLSSFPAGTNEIFIVRAEHDCSTCKSFIRQYGRIVLLENDGKKLTTIWDGLGKIPEPYHTVVKELAKFVKNAAISKPFFFTERKFGNQLNRKEREDGTIERFYHFYGSAVSIQQKKNVPRLVGNLVSQKGTLQRALEDLTLDSAEVVLELIQQGSLYRGAEHKNALLNFVKAKKKWEKLAPKMRERWLWLNLKSTVTFLRNSSIGTLLQNISAGMDLDTAVRKYEAIVAPANYKRPKAIFTKKMLSDAKQALSDAGLLSALKRRFATLDDISVNNVLFVDRDQRLAQESDIFSELETKAVSNPKKFGKVQEIGIEDFLKNVLPGSTKVEALIENSLNNNFVSLLAPSVPDSKTLFKWDNRFSWSYNGNLTDSSIKRNVSKAGGSVTGVLRFSIQWNENGDNLNDFDAHCFEPEGGEIFFDNKRNVKTGGELDIDIINPKGVAVENITWPDLNKMQEGVYIFFVRNYTHRGGTSGFRAEIEMGGEVLNFDYPHDVRHGARVDVAKIFLKDGKFKVVSSLQHSRTSKEIWGVQTNEFSPVSSIMYSPNFWDEKTVGNKHTFFFLSGCINDGVPRGIYNEFLKEDFNKHRKVFEALGGSIKIRDEPRQLSGVGFSSTVRNSLTVRVTGKTVRVMKINF